MSTINYSEKIPNNVNLGEDRTLQRALEQWQPNFLNWWDDVGPDNSPDSLTGMEASLRFCGPETLETKIFGRLSAWQNWIFQRPNAVGERGALTCYGTPQAPEFDALRT